MKCRYCKSQLTIPFLDLGSAPPSNSYLSEKEMHIPERWYPLRVMVCQDCWLVQTEDFADYKDLFSEDYAYFSSFSESWLMHAQKYVQQMVKRFHLDVDSTVIEIAANDGYLLQYVQELGINCIGIEPTTSTAAAARKKGLNIIESFFCSNLASQLVSDRVEADLIVANNVLAHVPDINDFVKGISILLKKSGVATFEFPHLLELVNGLKFDTVYHEHFSYLSLSTLVRIFRSNGLCIFDVDELKTHGGSIRVYARQINASSESVSNKVDLLLSREIAEGVMSASFYLGFQSRAEKLKNDFLLYLIKAKQSGKKIAAYGAAAKGNTILNYSGIRTDLITFVVDRNPLKQGKYMPGSRIPIVNEKKLKELKPNIVIILPWNLAEEIENQLSYIREWGGKFLTTIPEIHEH